MGFGEEIDEPDAKQVPIGPAEPIRGGRVAVTHGAVHVHHEDRIGQGGEDRVERGLKGWIDSRLGMSVVKIHDGLRMSMVAGPIPPPKAAAEAPEMGKQ